MSNVPIQRPDETEFAPFYAGYVKRIPEGDLLDLLVQQSADIQALLGSLSDADAKFRYGPDKWSIKQVVGHLGDVERIMTYRALCIARGEKGMLPGFDENAYVAAARFDTQPLASLLADWSAVRAATIAFFSGLDAEELARRGNANTYEVTVRALAYIIAGHERHHRAILVERYLGALSHSRQIPVAHE
jgi:uncharacterized damage-inducible protein DinB